MISTKSNASKLGTSRPEHPVAGVFSSASGMAGDLIELAELQVKLARADLKATLTHSVVPLTTLVLGIVIVFAALPSFAIGLALLLADQTQLAVWAAQLLVGAGLILLAGLMIVLALWRLRGAAMQMSTSVTEFAKNVAWVKEVVRGASHPPSNS